MTPSIQLFDEAALIERLLAGARKPWRPVVFLVGSPLTAPVSPEDPGVPGVAAMIEQVRQSLGGEADVPAPDAANPYQDAFATLQARRGQDVVNHAVRRAVLGASAGHPRELLDDVLSRDAEVCRRAGDALEEDLAGWHLSPGVESLGRLAARYPQHFGRTVLTSNFDPLIEISCRRAGRPCWRTTLHGDGHIQPGRGDVSHVVHVHGYWYGADTLHVPSQLRAPRPQLGASLRRLFEDVTLVVVAYGGWDDVFTRALFEVVSDGGAFPEVIWTFYARDEDAVRAGSASLLEGLRPGLERGRVALFGGIDCHSADPGRAPHGQDVAAALGRAARVRVAGSSGRVGQRPGAGGPIAGEAGARGGLVSRPAPGGGEGVAVGRVGLAPGGPGAPRSPAAGAPGRRGVGPGPARPRFRRRLPRRVARLRPGAPAALDLDLAPGPATALPLDRADLELPQRRAAGVGGPARGRGRAGAGGAGGRRGGGGSGDRRGRRLRFRAAMAGGRAGARARRPGRPPRRLCRGHGAGVRALVGRARRRGTGSPQASAGRNRPQRLDGPAAPAGAGARARTRSSPRS